MRKGKLPAQGPEAGSGRMTVTQNLTRALSE